MKKILGITLTLVAILIMCVTFMYIQYTVRETIEEKVEYSLHKYRIDSNQNANIIRTNITLETGEVHEVFIITNDTAKITNHCDDCRFCRIKNQ